MGIETLADKKIQILLKPRPVRRGGSMGSREPPFLSKPYFLAIKYNFTAYEWAPAPIRAIMCEPRLKNPAYGLAIQSFTLHN